VKLIDPMRRAGAALAVLLAGVLALTALAPAAHAAAPPDAKDVVASWKANGPLFVQDGAALTSSEESDVRDALESATSKIYALALPAGTVDNSSLRSYFTSLNSALVAEGRNRTTIAIIDGQRLYAASSALKQRNLAGEIANVAASANGGQGVTAVMQDFVKRVDTAATGNTRNVLDPESQAGSSPGGGGGSGTGVLVALLALVLAGGAGIFFYARSARKKREAREAAELAAVKQTVEEDVTKFGEEITALDLDVKMLGQGGDQAHLDDWQRALDSYERAKTELTAVQRPEQVREVTTALEDGRYALACVKARVNHEPVPERRAPCFFNPQHGPSARDVRWAPPGGAVRDVPACAADAEAVERGFDPQMREVMVNGQRVPYWNAGPAYQPYAHGYYGGFGDVMSMMLVGTMLGSMMSGGWGMGGYGAGYDAGFQQGMDAGGGGDVGGGDFGGDFGGGGGFDFGGGDFGGDW
jgi:hypothetical protein